MLIFLIIFLKNSEVNLLFGIITFFAGILGVIIGSGSASWYRKRNPRAGMLIEKIKMIFVVVAYEN